MSKDPRVPRASQEMQVCQAPQESEVSGLCLSLGALTWVAGALMQGQHSREWTELILPHLFSSFLFVYPQY